MTGLLQLRRRRLALVAALYAAVAIVALAVPALVANRQVVASHLIEQAQPNDGRQR